MYTLFRVRSLAQLAFLSTLILSLSGCGAWQSLKEGTKTASNSIFYTKLKQLKLDIVARHGLNQNERGQPLSTVIRVYQLKDNQGFEVAAYRDLLHQDRVLLADNLLSSKQITLRPGEAVNIDDEIHEQTEYIGVVAFFNRVDENNPTWKLLIEKKQLSNQRAIAVELLNHTVKLLVSKEERDK